MTEAEVIERLKTISHELMLLWNAAGSGNYRVGTAILDADIALRTLIDGEQQ